MPTVWRNPPEESDDLYPGLSVHDSRVSGSIVVGRSRLPLWSFVGWLPELGWDEVEQSYPDITGIYGWMPEDMSTFLHSLMQMRGEFGRLLLVLANAEMSEVYDSAWWDNVDARLKVIAQLKRCIEVLEL